MKAFLGKIRHGDGSGLSVLSSIVAVAAGLLVGLIILYISYANQALTAFNTIVTFGLTDLRNFGNVLYFATPVIMTGLSVGFAMKTGLFNIGASGQFTFGAFAAIYIAHKFTFIPPSLRTFVCLIGAMLLGALWGAIPGLLKALRNVHEVISCIMTNWIGIFLVNYTILNTSGLFDMTRNSTIFVDSDVNMPGWGLPEFFQGEAARPPAVNSGIIVAVLAAFIIYIILTKTKFGYELKACGFNRDAARYAGISEKRNIITSMMISGALAGLGGALHFLSGAGVTMNVADVLAPAGFAGISVALLGMSHPIGIIFSGVLIAYLQLGGNQIQVLGFVPEIIEIVIAVIIYFCAFILIIKMFLSRRSRRSGKIEESDEAIVYDYPIGTDPPPDTEPPSPENGKEGDK